MAKKFLNELQHPPAFIEIGVDRGVSFLTLVTFLARTKPKYLAVGIDIMVQDAVRLMLANIDVKEDQQSHLFEGNSLSVLPEMIRQNAKFDLLLIDGDHNYHTVKSELQFIPQITHKHSMIIIDDYSGRWGERDLFYSEREGYEDNKLATQRVETEKHGVKPAVDEWLAEHHEWTLSKAMQGEPVMLLRND